MPDANEKNKTLLYGLVLAGGKSARMKQDKSLLNYHGKTQVEYSFNLLSRICDAVFVSNREDQSDLPGHKGLPQIHDVYKNIGPLGGILSAMSQYPNVSWLVMACDLPFVDDSVLAELVRCRNAAKEATAYISATDALPEPLCAVYEPRFFSSLLKSLTENETCPRQIMMNSDVCLVPPRNKRSLANINHPEEWRTAHETLRCKPSDGIKSEQ